MPRWVPVSKSVGVARTNGKLFPPRLWIRDFLNFYREFRISFVPVKQNFIELDSINLLAACVAVDLDMISDEIFLFIPGAKDRANHLNEVYEFLRYFPYGG